MSGSLALSRTVMQRLRVETRDEHAATERALALLSPELTLDDYRDCLARFRGYYAPLERRLHAVPGVASLPLAFENRLKTAHLDADLLDLGCADPPALPQCSALPSLQCVADALGCLYVIEGASLGGQLISRHLAQVLGIGPARGGRFFCGYGARTGAMWRAFGEAATAFATSEARERRMIAAATDTFRTMRMWLTPQRDTR